MPTLLERTTTLNANLAALDELGARRSTFEKLRTRSAQLKDGTTSLENIIITIGLLTSHGLPIGKWPTPSKELRSKPDKITTALASDWLAVIEDSQLSVTFFNPIESQAQKLREFALGIWRQHTDKAVPNIDDASVAALGKVFGSQIMQLQNLKREFEALRTTLPSGDMTFTELDRVAREIMSIWQQLKGVPEAVRAFLGKAAQRQATISDLTPDVRDWLEKNSMLSQLRVGFA